MSRGGNPLRIGFIALVDAAPLFVAVDRGLAAAEGLALELVREVSWSNVRDKLHIGLLDAAHLLAPVAVASNLGVGHVRVPLIAPINLGLNGNAVTVSPELHARLAAHADGHVGDPSASARALARVVADNRANGAAPLTFGMTFPFSNHNYQLRFWMAAGGVDPDEDVRLVVLPPPYMVDSMARGHVDGFCVGAPWSQVAVDQGIGRVLHFGCDLQARLTEKVLAVRAPWIARSPEILRRLLRTLDRAIAFVDDPDNLDEVAAILTRPGRIEVAPDMIRRTLEGRLIVGPHTERTNGRYLMIGRAGAARPDPVHAAWIYAQMVRWRQAPLSDELLAQAAAVFRPDLYDAALGVRPISLAGEPVDHVGAFAGAPFDPRDIAGYLQGSAGADAPLAGGLDRI
jgi:ABC-type nitrate/sulfonate/bicarbonate transport system substrate-binding protein